MPPNTLFVGTENSRTTTLPPGLQTRAISLIPASVFDTFRSPNATDTIWNVSDSNGSCWVSASRKVTSL